MKVYVASTLTNAENVKKIYNILKENNIEIMYDWTSFNFTKNDLDNVDKIREVALNELCGAMDCDLLFMVAPAKLGAHVELGAALASRILRGSPEIVFLTNDDIEFKTFYQFEHIHKFDKLEKAIEFIMNFNKEQSNV